METKLFSPLITSTNNILGNKRTLTKRSKDYQSFINFLYKSNKDLQQIKLPSKRKVKNLSFDIDLSVGSGGAGGGGGGILGSLLGGLGLRKLLKGKFFGGEKIGKFKGSYEDIIKNLYKKENLTKGERFALRDYERLVGKGGLSNNDAAFRALGRNQYGGEYLSGYGENVRGGGFSSEIASQYRQAGRAGGGGFGGEAPRGRFGRIGGGLLNVGLAAYDFYGRKQEGQTNLQAGVGAAGGAIGGIAGWEAGAAAGAAIGSLFGGVGAVPGAIIGGLLGGFAGGSLGSNIADKLTGADKEKPKDKITERLKEQERKQREAASKKITFADIVNKFDKVVTKFEKISSGISGMGGKGQQSSQQQVMEYGEYGERDESPSPIQGDLKDMEATGGTVPSSSPITGTYGESRPGHKHAGIDFGVAEGTPISVIQPGTVSSAEFRPNGYGNQVKVDHPGGVSSFYAHLSSIGVRVGQQVEPGTVIGAVGNTGHSFGAHLHFEVDVNGVRTNPTSYADKIFRFGGNIKVKENKKNSKSQDNGLKLNTLTKQQSIEDFVKGTKEGDRVLKDPNLKAQLTGKKYQYRGSMVTTPVTDPTVKQFIQNYNDYVRNIRQVRADQTKVRPQARPELPTEISTPQPTDTSGSSLVIVNNQPQAQQAAPQVIPVPVPVGGGGGGAPSVQIDVGEVVNSFAKLILLTNLSGS